jgi:predicted RNA polymerase sigma factor
MPDEPEIGGLLALLLFQHSRREARTDRSGDVITLEEQDHSRWIGAEIANPLVKLNHAVAVGWQPARRMASSSSAGSKRRASCATTTSCTRLAQTSCAG